MTSSHDTGHAKNHANFEEMISFVIGYGIAYNPSNKNLSLAAIQTQSAETQSALHAVNSAYSVKSLAVSSRETTFEPLSKLATRILNAVKACGTMPQVEDSVSNLVKKLHGKRITAKLTEAEKAVVLAEGKEVHEYSASQMSYNSRVENFDKLIELLSSIPEYKPNEEELKVASLSTFHRDLVASNNAVVSTSTTLSNARITRNKMLYATTTGLVDTAGSIKLYVKSLFGADSPQYKQISKLKFISFVK